MTAIDANRLRRLRWAESAIDFLLDRLADRLAELAERRAVLDQDIEAFSRAGGLPARGWGAWIELCRRRRELFAAQCELRRGAIEMRDRKRLIQRRITRLEGSDPGPETGEAKERWRRFLLDPVHLTGEEPDPRTPGPGGLMRARSGPRRT